MSRIQGIILLIFTLCIYFTGLFIGVFLTKHNIYNDYCKKSGAIFEYIGDKPFCISNDNTIKLIEFGEKK